MSRQPPKRKSSSISKLTAMRRLRLSWTRWLLRRTNRKLPKENLRLSLMQAQVELQALHLSSLLSKQARLELELREQLEIKAYWVEGIALPPARPISELEQELLE